jgi:type II secretory pathway pseudopilin PulG
MRAVTRAGFSTVELLVAFTMAAVIATSLATVLRRQQRFFTNAAIVVERRVSLRDATAILQSELRGISPAGGDILAFSDSALEIRTTIGGAVACDTLPAGAGVDLAPVRPPPAVPLASFSTSPQPRDIAIVFDQGASPRDDDDRWVAAEIADAAPVATSCLTSPLPGARADASASGLRLRFTSAALPPTVNPGAFVRVLRHVRYRLYRAGTGEWYLGYAEWDGSGFSTVQPVSGPFASYSRRAGASGLALRYFDDAGAQLALPEDAARIARVEVVARSSEGTGLSDVSTADSQAVTVRPRNR